MTRRPAHPFANPEPRRVKPPKRDTPDEAREKAAVRARDRGCVAQRATGIPMTCDGPLEVDHVRASGGLSVKSLTHRSNMVVLCSHHHRAKTNYGRTWRPFLLDYIEKVGDAA